ncbi:Calcineurin-like phosphoesterase [Jatrophihabitans endophyticus]|uniref:Calcineurin-like phosphoesterase n=1 Tax=Jatrophihabitans endophyticus TaxID=1206085 RepID=A0A1M5EB67_9ACTN|nr:metallophosphoesterase [Jatrophihabitans endophyticus]SHF76384.1 Calcineurin-like phosphoesterase [Jatrophihabitans endophyticus]
MANPARPRAVAVLVTVVTTVAIAALAVLAPPATPRQRVALNTADTADTAATAAGTAAARAPRIADPMTFQDSFDNGRLDGWRVTDETTRHGPSRWTARGGAARQRSNVYAGATDGLAHPGTMLLSGNGAWRDYDLAVTATSRDDDAFGLVFRYVDRNNFYRFSLDRERHVRRLVAKVRGRYRLLAEAPGGYRAGTGYRLRVRAVGADLRAFVNGRQVLHAVDASVGRGRFGLYTWSNPTSFDAFHAAVRTEKYVTIALLPDTQHESQSAPGMFAAQTTWLARCRAQRNIVAVLHEGDVVDELQDRRQWRNARSALLRLAGKVPLTVAAGNHDILRSGAKRPVRAEPAAFDRLVSSLPGYRVDGRYRRHSSQNTYQLLDAGGLRLVVLNLTYGPSNAQLRWAGRVAHRYRDREVVLLTHDYLGQDGRRRGRPGDRHLPSSSSPARNDGTAVWSKFVRRHANVRFTFNVHVITPTHRGGHYSVGRRVSRDAAGRRVYQVLTNFQSMRRGAGYLRLVRLYPATNRVEVETYSPYLHRSLTGRDNRFAFTGVDLRH